MDKGYTFKTNQGSTCKIIEYINSKNILVEFQDSHNYRVKVEIQQIKKGSVKNPFHPTIEDKGYLGIGPFIAGLRNNPDKRQYRVWRHMLKRVYRKTIQLSYNDCDVHPDWLNYQNFAKWHKKHYLNGFAIDKDILVPGNRTYSEKTCIMVPQWLNNSFSCLVDEDESVGVHKRRDHNFRARISTFGNPRNLGTFKTQKEARDKYVSEKLKFFFQCLYHKDTPAIALPRLNLEIQKILSR